MVVRDIITQGGGAREGGLYLAYRDSMGTLSLVPRPLGGEGSGDEARGHYTVTTIYIYIADYFLQSYNML